jgi:hypothetical protein
MRSDPISLLDAFGLQSDENDHTGAGDGDGEFDLPPIDPSAEGMLASGIAGAGIGAVGGPHTAATGFLTGIGGYWAVLGILWAREAGEEIVDDALRVTDREKEQDAERPCPGGPQNSGCFNGTCGHDPSKPVEPAGPKGPEHFPYGCFTLQTIVTMADGSAKEIGDIREGDRVLSYNEQSGVCEEDEVVAAFDRRQRTIIAVDVEGDTIECTADHPFYTLPRKDWVEAGQLSPGDWLISSTLEKVEFHRISGSGSIADVRTLRVKKNHNFFIGKQSLLVHNK